MFKEEGYTVAIIVTLAVAAFVVPAVATLITQ